MRLDEHVLQKLVLPLHLVQTRADLGFVLHSQLVLLVPETKRFVIGLNIELVMTTVHENHTDKHKISVIMSDKKRNTNTSTQKDSQFCEHSVRFVHELLVGIADGADANQVC